MRAMLSSTFSFIDAVLLSNRVLQFEKIYDIMATKTSFKGGNMNTPLLLAGSAWEEFVSIFTGEFAWLTIILMVVGMVLCIIEAIVPGFGIFGISGILCEVAAVVVNATLCQGSPLQVLILILIMTLVTLLIFLLFVRSARFGLLGKTSIVENKSSIPSDYGKEDAQKLQDLIGKEGILVTECHPIGNIRIGDQVLEVSSRGGIIPKGDVVKVVAVENNVIYVSKITY